MYKIMLVEDDVNLAEGIKKQLSSYGNEIAAVSDFRNVIGFFREYQPHLVLLDIMLPFYTGYYWCTEIRRLSSVPIVFISSVSDNMNVVTAINLGADDFITKPVDPLVLNAKVQATLRRCYEISGDTSVVEFHGAFLNLNDATVSFGEKKIDLTKNEFRILSTLIEHKGRIVSRDELMTALWQSDLYIEENTLTVNVGRLRKKLEENGMKDVIITKPGSGYMLK